MLAPAASRPTLHQALLAVAAALILASHSATADDTQEASKLLRAGQHQQALERVNRVLAAKPRDPQARFLRGLILTEQGSTKDAIDVFTRLTQDYPELPEPYNNLAVIYAAQGQYDKARAALEQSIRTHPSYATAYENLGDVYAKLASQAYDKALQLDTTNSAAQNKLALVRELVGNTPRAAQPPVAAKDQKPAVSVPPVATAAAPASAAKAADAKPAAERPAAKSAPGGDQEIVEMLNAWAKAWSKKDADAYLAFYAKDFRTPGGEPRAAWEKARRQRIAAPKSIAVSVDAAKVSVADDSRANVNFRQTYRSDLLKTSSTKTLVLVKADGRWLIQQEKAGN